MRVTDWLASNSILAWRRARQSQWSERTETIRSFARNRAERPNNRSLSAETKLQGINKTMAVGKRRQLQTETGLDLGETLFAVKKRSGSMAKRNLRMRRQHATLHTTHAPPSLTTDVRQQTRERNAAAIFFHTNFSRKTTVRDGGSGAEETTRPPPLN